MKVLFGLIGLGEWGKNLARAFHLLPSTRILSCCDIDEGKFASIQPLIPGAKFTKEPSDILSHPDIEAVVIASNPSTHYPLAKDALGAGKHVFVEKPMALKAHEAMELIQLAEERKKKLMVGHLLLYHPAVSKLKEMIGRGELGELYYLYSQRVNLGRIRSEESALWSFAPHDVAMVLYLLDHMPLSISARGERYLQEGLEDVVFLSLKFPQKIMAQLQVSWLDPHKIRRLTVVGSKKMAVFDDMESTEKLRIYDKGVSRVDYLSYGDSLTLRFGDILIPHIKMTEPLRLECQHFVDCILHDKTPLTDGHEGFKVVKILEAAEKSLREDGAPVKWKE